MKPARIRRYLMSLANTGKCPICGIGQASTLDHYLAKTIYPTYAVTPYNLVPVCKDCNFAKSDSIMREEFKTYLTELLAAKESFQYNTWNTALLRALIENIDIVVSEE